MKQAEDRKKANPIKKPYEAPLLEIMGFEAEDIMAVSTSSNGNSMLIDWLEIP